MGVIFNFTFLQSPRKNYQPQPNYLGATAMPSHEESSLSQNEENSDFLAIINYYIQDVSIYNCIKHGSISGKKLVKLIVSHPLTLFIQKRYRAYVFTQNQYRSKLAVSKAIR